VQSPKCGNGNNPLDKAGAVTVLGLMTDALA
jgi:DEAD/DEAH box helicase domain-containing protein